MKENKDDPSDIAQRLEKLNQWQEEQKRILFERQSNQRKLLGLEQQKMYQILGIFPANHTLLEEQDAGNKTSDNDTTLGVSILDQTDNEEKGYLQQKEEQQKTGKPKRPFLRRKQGLITRFKMDPDKFRLNNIPPYKFSSNHPSLKNKTSTKPLENKDKSVELKTTGPVCPIPKQILKLKLQEKPKNSLAMDLLEEKFQKSLISSKNACNSTPDLKSQLSSTKETETTEPISWATILDPQNIKPIEKQAFQSNRQETNSETDNLSIFELLEQKAKNGSFDMNSSCIKRFLRNNEQNSDEDTTIEPSVLKKLAEVPYEIYRNPKFINSDLSGSEEEEDDDITPRPSNQVHFADPPHTEEYSPKRNISALDNSDASQVFEEFKKLLFASQNDAITDITNSNDLAQEILQKAELVKERLQQLESEIDFFRKNNLELVKSKQEHELAKAHFEQERTEHLEKMNDEKIQMEIYLHDERMKIEDDRKKMEKQIKTQKSLASAKDKKETAKLREEIENLQKELKKKDDSHIAAQSRLRAQVRNLEKDVKQLNIEIDALNKENKRLEAENLKISRENNSKMLQEINRSIAKLAPKMATITNIDESHTEKNASASQQQARPKAVPRRKIAVVKKKPSPVKLQNSPVTSSDEISSNASSNDAGYSPITVTLVKLPTPPSKDKSSTEKADPNETPRDSADASFKREIRNPDGSKDIWYQNGNLKKISADGMTVRMLYFNKDIKETNINEGTVKYYYAETNTWHTTYLDGLEILEFPNGQTEHRYKDGKIEVHFPNNSIKITNPSDEHKQEEWRFADGTNLIQMKNGDKILLLPNGQKEIHTALSKRREYPDGTVKLVYPDGSQETRYSNGRVRLKDCKGNLVMDTENVKY